MARLNLGSKEYGTQAPDAIRLDLAVEVYVDPAMVGYDIEFTDLVDLLVARIKQIDIVTDAI